MSIERTSSGSDAGLVFRLLVRVVKSPAISLSAVGFVIAGFSLAAQSAQTAFLVSLLLPWVGLTLMLLSMPTIGAVIHRYRLPDQTRRNHSLEHGTIYFLRKHYGKRYKLSGHAEEHGFRVAGARTETDIQRAFAELVRELKLGNDAIVVARGCGSNMVTAQALGLVLMALLAVGVLVFRIRPLVVVIAEACILMLVIAVRYPFGMWIQRRRFLLLDFTDASILGVHPVSRAELFERHPVFFVRTQVVPGTSGTRK